MKTVLALCLAALVVMARGQVGVGRFPPRGAVNHLDVGLPNPLFGSSSPLLIHLKDQGLWNKENGGESGRSRAALLPSILKSIAMNQHREESPEFDYTDISTNTEPKSPMSLVRNLLDEQELPSLRDLEEMVQDDELALELYDSEKTEDRDHFFFKLREALKSMGAREHEDQSHGSKGLRSQSGREGGLWFNLEDLESELKRKLPGGENLDLGSGDVSEKQVLVDLVELLKEYVARETEASADAQRKEDTEVVKVVQSETEANAKILEELKKSNVTIRGVDSSGGIFFSLKEEQENGDDIADA